MADASSFPAFLDLPEALRDPSQSAAWVLPVPFERTSSYGLGSADAPSHILHASAQVEFYDEDLGREPCQAGIATRAPLAPAATEIYAAVDELNEEFREEMTEAPFLLAIGGEHTITPAAVRAAAERHGELTVLQIDAHADLRESYEGSRWSHACAMRRLLDCAHVVGVGIRALSLEEARDLPALPVTHIPARQCAEDPDWMDRAIDALGAQVYVTVDMDGFDPSVAPSVGTPEPGGLSWWQVTNLLRRVCAERNVVAADIVECNPSGPEDRTAFLAARLAYKLIGFVLDARGTG